MADETEIWLNASAGRAWVWTHNQIGEKTDRQVPAGGKLQITTADRQLNQEMAVSDDLDVFKNGTLVPVRLIESAADFAEIQENPNNLTEDDLTGMFELPWKSFDKRVGEITNRATIERLVAIAEGSVDEEGVDATMRQTRVLRDRLTELVGVARVDSVDGNPHVVSTPDGSSISPVTP